MKSREQKALDWVNGDEIDRDQKKLEKCIAFCLFLLVFCVAITGCGTYCWDELIEMLNAEETVSCEEKTASETTDRWEVKANEISRIEEHY